MFSVNEKDAKCQTVKAPLDFEDSEQSRGKQRAPAEGRHIAARARNFPAERRQRRWQKQQRGSVL